MLKRIFGHNDFTVQSRCILMHFISSIFKRNNNKMIWQPQKGKT